MAQIFGKLLKLNFNLFDELENFIYTEESDYGTQKFLKAAFIIDKIGKEIRDAGGQMIETILRKSAPSVNIAPLVDDNGQSNDRLSITSATNKQSQQMKRTKKRSNKNTFECYICKYPTEWLCNLERHMRKHTVRKCCCQLCLKHFAERTGWSRKSSSECNICGKRFPVKAKLNFHMQNKHN